jgi:SET domain-containing protein
MPSLKDRILKHLSDEVYCRLGVSKTHGVGVFAIRSIEKGQVPLRTPVRKREVKITQEELSRLPKSVQTQVERFCYHDEHGYYVPSCGFNTMDLSVYLNHSKKPNLYFTKKGILKSLRKIQKGEELTIDYDKSFGGKHRF